MVTKRRLTDETDVQLFARRYQAVGGFPLQVESIESAEVFGFFYRDQLVGGMVVNSRGPYRALQDMPPQRAAALLDDAPTTGMYEITCVWMVPEMRGTMSGTRAWMFALSELAGRRRQRLIVCAVNEGMRCFYERMGFTLVYVGEIPMTDGSVLPKYVFTMDQPRRILPGASRELLRRLNAQAKVRRARLTEQLLAPAVLLGQAEPRSHHV